MIIKEACLETIDEFNSAFNHHANQYEVCSRLDLAGLTPDLTLVKNVLDKSNHIMVMIRRKDDYTADANHLEELLEDIRTFINTPIQGFVFGYLNDKSEVDLGIIKQLVKACGNKETVFHMAFDAIVDWKKAIDQLVDLKVTRILTKGGINGPAINNIAHLKELKAYANNRIQLIVGGGVNDDNCQFIYNQTGIERYHGRKLAIK
jgi:copper homeostasis protein